MLNFSITKKMTHTVIATMKFKDEESFAEFKTILASEDGIAKTRKFEGCINIQCYQPEEQENTFIIYQQWRAKDDHTKYMEMRKEEGLLGKISENFREPLEVVHLSYYSV